MHDVAYAVSQFHFDIVAVEVVHRLEGIQIQNTEETRLRLAELLHALFGLFSC